MAEVVDEFCSNCQFENHTDSEMYACPYCGEPLEIEVTDDKPYC